MKGETPMLNAITITILNTLINAHAIHTATELQLQVYLFPIPRAPH